MAQQKRRVSYVIPPSPDPVSRLQLPPLGVPRLGVVSPLLIPIPGQNGTPERSESPTSHHPRHRLGVASLAFDTSTQLVGKSCPEGILYSGGRDGLIISWDMGISTKKRKLGAGRIPSGKWEVLTGWADDVIDEENEDEDRVAGDGDILGDVNLRRQRLLPRSGDIPYEQVWETDISAFRPGVRSEFRQCAEVHSDWVNDITLCNYNQTVVSASSDGTIKAWNPHSATNSDPTQIGSHNDYVRCLTYCREQNWVASGSFDRTVRLWDLNASSTKQPLVTLNPPDATAPKSSVYALSCDPFGRTIASGSPERVIRLWDPRSGKRTGKLVGHTDNIRAILISEDARYLLTGSADASIKLWSLSSQRCLHTFTHHTDSVWSLFSSHPSLEIFYSGDRSGLVCRVDVEDCSDVSEGECIVLCQDSGEPTRSASEGINKIVAMDDNLLWVASGTSDIKRWHIPQRRATRLPPPILTDFDGDRIPYAESPTTKKRMNISDHPSELAPRQGSGSPRASFTPSMRSSSSDHLAPPHYAEQGDTLCGIPMDSLVKLISPNDPFTSFHSSRSRDPEVATLYSAASVMSVPRANAYLARSPTQTLFQHQPQPNPTLLHSSRTEDTFTAPVANSARANYEARELAADAVPLASDPDDVIKGDHGLVRSLILNDRTHALTVDTSGEVAVWDIIRGACKGKFSREDVYAASHAGSIAGESNCEREKSPREALEIVRERIEGEAVISSWCSADTKAGVLAVHITEKCFEAEIYADEVGFEHDKNFSDETKLNIGKWVLRNLFINFIREEQRTRRTSTEAQDGLLAPSLGRITTPSDSQTSNGSGSRKSPSPEPTRKAHRTSGSRIIINSPKMVPAIAPSITSSSRSSPLLPSLIPLNAKDGHGTLPVIPQSPGFGSDGTMAMPSFPKTTSFDGGSTPLPSTPSVNQGDFFTARVRQSSLQGPGAAGPAEDTAATTGKPDAQGPSIPSGLMGRLRNFGRSATRRPVSDGAATSPVLGNTVPAVVQSAATESATQTIDISNSPLQTLLAGRFSPPTSAEAPLYYMPPNTTLIISEEASPSYNVIYRGTTGATDMDPQALEEAMPMWLIEYLLLNKLPPISLLPKISFVLMPWNRDPESEPLPELLNTQQSKLTASRHLRVRKIVTHVQEKMEKIAAGSRAPSIRSSVEENARLDGHHSKNSLTKMRAEDEYEIVCNETLLPLTMTLAAVRQYAWKQGSELIMHYRRKAGAGPGVVGRRVSRD